MTGVAEQMQHDDGDEPQLGLAQLHALTRLATLVRDRPTDEVLAAVGDAVRTTCGYRTVAVNVYDAADDRYVVATIAGSSEAQAALSGTSYARSLIDEVVLQPQWELGPGVFFVPAGSDSIDRVPGFRPPEVATAHPHGDGRNWDANDTLVVALRTADGRPLGLISIDEPLTGARPTADAVEPIVAMAAHAAATIESANARAEADRHTAALGGLLRFSLSPPTGDQQDIAQQTCDIATSHLGYASAALLVERRGRLEVAGAAGFTDGELHGMVISSGLHEVHIGGRLDDDGCALVRGEHLDAQTGRGPYSWGIRRLAARMIEPGGRAFGLLVVDRPRDRLAPTLHRRLELRMLADHAVGALISHRQRADLAFLASHDPLTGLANRRALEEALDALLRARTPAAVAIFDLDRFKTINDRYGHAEGDRVLARFGRLLAEVVPAEGCAARLGGEEFCAVLPGASIEQGMELADLVRSRCLHSTSGSTPGVSVSAGVAASDGERITRRDLMIRADAALYRAKDSGRDRSEAARAA